MISLTRLSLHDVANAALRMPDVAGKAVESGEVRFPYLSMFVLFICGRRSNDRFFFVIVSQK